MAKKDQRPNNLSQALGKISTLITDFSHSLSKEGVSHRFGSQPWMSFSRGEDGGLELSGDEVRRYHECLDAVGSAVNTDVISRKAIDEYLKDAIMAALDVNNRRANTSFEQRIEDALVNLKNKVSAKPITWHVHYRVSRLEPTFNPSNFGRVNFIVFNDDYFNPIKETLKHNAKDEKSRDIHLQQIRDFTEEPLSGRTVAIVEVAAIDDDAARSQALKELLLTIDVINFYSDIFYSPKSAYVSLYGAEDRSWESIPVFIPGDEPKLMQYQKAIGRLQPFLMSELIHGKGQELGSARISEILAKSNRNSIEERILSAMQWAGRATIDERQEEAFLLYAIALECLIMEKGNEPELGYRLRMRVAHLLGEDLNTRQDIKSIVNRLYGIRSSIVHKGEYIVPDSELKILRFFTKGSIMRILIEEPFVSMKSDDELLGWFDKQLLS
jgi:hypothetical protein